MNSSTLIFLMASTQNELFQNSYSIKENKKDLFFFKLTIHCVLFQARFSIYNLALVVAE